MVFGKGLILGRSSRGEVGVPTGTGEAIALATRWPTYRPVQYRVNARGISREWNAGSLRCQSARAYRGIASYNYFLVSRIEFFPYLENLFRIDVGEFTKSLV